MTKQEISQLLYLINLAYPTAYRNLDAAATEATIETWYQCFMPVPYTIMTQALSHYVIQHKYPPTIAEICAVLRHMHYHALECALIHKSLGNQELVAQHLAIMQHTACYKTEVPPNTSNTTLQITDAH